MSNAPRKNVGILIFDDVEVLDFAGPFEVFSRTRTVAGADSRRSDDSAPFHTFTVARSEIVTAIGGLKVMPHHLWSDAPAIDILVIPGGFGTRALLNDEPTLAWIRRSAAAAMQVTSVCTGALLLAKIGLLRGRRATTHSAATDEEIRAASLQFVRKLSGFTSPSKANEAAFDLAIDETAAVARRLIDSLSTNAAPRNREEVAAAAKLRSAERFGV